MVLPERKTQLLLAPGNRADILVRAPRSGTLLLKTLPFNQGRLIFGEDVLATVEVAGRPGAATSHRCTHAGTLPTFPSRRGPTRTWFQHVLPANGDGRSSSTARSSTPIASTPSRASGRPSAGS